MVTRKAVRRGEVWLVGLDPTVGREIRKTRPCLIVSPDSMNRFLSTVTALPLTSVSQPAGFRVPVEFNNTNGLLLADQLRTLDRARLIKRLGTLDGATVEAALAVLRDMFEP
jgi:mRNA interferase MazF